MDTLVLSKLAYVKETQSQQYGKRDNASVSWWRFGLKGASGEGGRKKKKKKEKDFIRT